MVKATFTAIVGAAALALLTVGASAAPLSAGKGVDASAASMVEKVHGCHESVDRDHNGWHYHGGYNCRRRWAESPRRHYSDPPRGHYSDRRHYEHRRGPVCKRECKYVGPIKICEDKCW